MRIKRNFLHKIKSLKNENYDKSSNHPRVYKYCKNFKQYISKNLASQKVQTIPKMIAISGPPTDNLIQ